MTDARKRSGTFVTPRNSLLAESPGAIVKALELFSLRGAPTILRMLSKFRPLREMTATVRLKTGELMFFPAFDSYWCRHAWASAPYELDVEQIFRKLGKGRVLVDCGANIGYWSIRAQGFGFTEVIAIEANRQLIPFLTQNFRLNGVQGAILHAAVYSTSDQTVFLDHTEDHAVGGIGEHGIPVTTITIQDAVRHLPQNEPILAKLDVEGAEIPAFEGAKGIRNIIYIYEDFVRLDMAVTRYLLERGMAVFGVEASGNYCRIESVESALAFRPRQASLKSPMNLLACSVDAATQLEKELSKF